ncbi:DNA polymerase III subunit gamma/tau [soil metagenome]
MSYLVLARKYRPQSFEDLVGQEHVAKTIANAIEQGRVAHAFLFTGVRGVGKTTSARLLAKCLNCLGPDGQAKGPTATPCNVCAACNEITAGSDMDVQEIDGASYNGVDEVRRLQEGLAFRPARDRYKVFIVDEVHMLSSAAWNAFLKTLEEPPPHVKFIFATTEVHKVPVTILSRCQRYDFKLISTQTIAARVKDVLAKENIAAEANAIAVIAREAAGSMRDAMSLLDQVIAFSGSSLAEADVTRVLGFADRKLLHDLCEHILGGDAKGALETIDRLAHQGFDLVHVAKDLLASFRNLVVAKVSGEAGRELLDLADEEVADVVRLAQKSELDDLLRLFHGFSKAYDDVARSGKVRAALEMTLVRLARRPPLLPLDELLSRLGELERRLATGAPPPPRGGGRPASGGGGAKVTQASSNFAFTAPQVVERNDSSSRSSRMEGSLALAPQPDEATPLPPSGTEATGPKPVPKGQVLPFAPPASTRDGASCDMNAWRAIVGLVRAERPALASVFEHAIVVEVNPRRVRVGYAENDFLGSQATQPESLALLRSAVRGHFGADVEVEVKEGLRATKEATVFAIENAQRKVEQAQARAAVENHPLVREIVTVLGAELRDVRVPTPREGDE